MNLAHFGATIATSALASSVEAVEAMTVVLAVGITRGWRTALAGAAAGLALLVGMVAALGPTLAAVPTDVLRVATGALLVLFGIRWLRKAILRAAGVIALRDEDAAFDERRRMLGASAGSGGGIDAIGALTALKALLLEGIEVVVIVIGIGAAGGMLLPASVGALAACLAVVAVAVALRRPLARVPENALKLAVGMMVTAFGIYWFGEGVGIAWRFGEFAILAIMATMLGTAALGIRLAREARKP